MQNSYSRAVIEISVSENSTEDAVQVISDYLMELEEYSFCYDVTCEIQVDDKEWTFRFWTGKKPHDYENVLGEITEDKMDI